MIDYLIVGQGIAGTLMGYFLQKAGKQIHVVDNDSPRSSSKHAAGIINPVTGRRFVKSWRIEDLMPFAHRTYQTIEKEFDIQVFEHIPLIRTLYDQNDRNNWMLRITDPGYEEYMDGKAELGPYEGHLHPAFSYGQTLQTARLDVPAFIAHFRRYWESRGAYSTTQLSIEDLDIQEEGVSWGGLQARQVICCEGSWGKQNPYFSYLPFRGAKGEVLEVEIPDANFDRILKRKVFVVPLQNGNYWIGTTNTNWFTHEMPTLEGKAELVEKLKAFLKLDFEIVAHHSAIRPTVKDRRPFIGAHPVHPRLGIFNGLGTKGASLGPFWADHYVKHLLHGSDLDPEVDIRRYPYPPAE
ncbi:MAG: FAD-binding oxidoreductase [Saprospiraceae bacterium]|nr:FAD-binding oxidoreductase [Saprospiraceae bacterium]